MTTLNKYQKGMLAVIAVGVIILIICFSIAPTANTLDNVTDTEKEILNVSLDITEHYITNTGDPSNLYYVDEENILWGCGENNYGQLGQGVRDEEYYDEMLKIAEDVVHVDYSQKGFVIYLTKDNKLYGMGNASGGALQQYDKFDWEKYINGEHYYISKPYLLMENVKYARCGKDDIVCLTENGEVWTWGTICINGGFNSANVYFVEKPKKILDNAVLVTGGWFNHAALLQDGTVWTWGYNYTGNCGVKDQPVVKEPQKVADDVIMVWTNSLTYNVDCYDISEFEGEYPRFLENTIIKKSDGTYWICGVDVGTEERTIPFYYEVSNISLICTHEFQPIENSNIKE